MRRQTETSPVGPSLPRHDPLDLSGPGRVLVFAVDSAAAGPPGPRPQHTEGGLLAGVLSGQDHIS